MNRGLYDSASAILTLNRNMEVKTHNIANVNTVGYKYNNAHNNVFEEVMLSYKGENLGIVPTRVGVEKITTVYSQGAFMNTQRNLDVAIAGDGYIKIDRGNNQFSYTRNGNLKVDSDGYLVDFNGNYVMGQNGTIRVPSADGVSFKNDGTILYNNTVIDKLYVTALENPQKQTLTYFTAEGEKNGTFSVNQGYLEASNVDTAKEMVDVISIQRLLTTNSKMLQAQDELNKKMIDSIK